MGTVTTFIVRFKASILLLIYVVSSALFLLSNDSKIVGEIRETHLAIFSAINEKFTKMSDYFDLRAENLTLKQQLTQKSLDNFQLQNARLENIRLKKLLKFKYRFEYDLVPAKIIGDSPHNFVSGFLTAIDDSMDVPANTAVVTSSGLVGKIVSKNGNFAICQNLIDPNSRISVRIQRNRELGIVSWDGGENLLLNNIPNTVTVQKGDVLYTSGMSLIYPPHIKVGVVQSVSKNNGQLFQTIYVKPAVNFKRIEEVFIVKGKIINES